MQPASTPLTRQLRLARAITRLEQAYIRRRADGRPVAHLLSRVGPLSRCLLACKSAADEALTPIR
jgi:hypothetical protein